MGYKAYDKDGNPNPKMVAYQTLEAQGVSHVDICKMIGITPQTGHQLTYEMRKAELPNILDSQYIKPVIKTLKKLAKGQLVGEMTKIEGNTVINACKVFTDRAYPEVSYSQVSHSLDINPVSMAQYKNVPPVEGEATQAIDAEVVESSDDVGTEAPNPTNVEAFPHRP